MSDPVVPQDMDKLIHEPARLAIMTQLYVVESADFIFVMQRTGLTWGNLSSHLSKLENAGYVAVTKEFVDKKPHTLLKLTPHGRTAFETYREQMEAMLAGLPKQSI
ncbi:MAG: transcriptional regulator [Lentisphaeria bacterium]|nr:transcriptional regulator [Candidatus Neomarinimicrobiota bacterium]MCF7842777.1 transcriptional regulator [Lentisphaeria bacterium]